jgi:hypothetical protein
MDDEFYQIEVSFDVAMTAHNYERGNLYLQSEFLSFRKGVKPLVLARSGYLDPKGSFTLLRNEMLAMLPLSRYFSSCGQTEEVVITIFDKFDNQDFGLEAINFLVPNEAL